MFSNRDIDWTADEPDYEANFPKAGKYIYLLNLDNDRDKADALDLGYLELN